MDRDSRRISNEKQGKIKTSNQIPTATEGQDGDMVMVNGQLYIKSNNTWSSYSSAESSAGSKVIFQAQGSSGWDMAVNGTFADVRFNALNIDTYSTYDVATYTYRVPPGMGGIYYVYVKITIDYDNTDDTNITVLALDHNKANSSSAGHEESWGLPSGLSGQLFSVATSSLFLADDGDTFKSQVKIEQGGAGSDKGVITFDDKCVFYGFKIN